MAKTEGKTNVEVRVGDKVTLKTITSIHNDNPDETDREIAEAAEKYREEKS